MNATTSPPAIRMRLQLPSVKPSFSRADLVFLGLEHAGPSVEVRIFFNAPDADASTPPEASAGFAGFFSIFAHGGCFGDEGHCDMPERRPTDRRPPYALTPFSKHVTVTKPVERLYADGVLDVQVTFVPILHNVPAYVPEDLLAEPVVFERLSIVFYQ
jgi:tyrosinase